MLRFTKLNECKFNNIMSKIVTQDKLNELTGMSVDLGRGGG